MRVWLYARLSNDDGAERNSLENQLQITRDYAFAHGHTVVGFSFDDNRSGMRFDREGLDAMSQAVEAGELDGVIVKDLSRLGRHRVQTALFLEYLLQCGVRVLSATEGLDSANEEDDLIISARGLMNDYYAKDIGRKVRAGYRQKQQEGIVIRPPFGYEKDRNNRKIVLCPTASETVKMIYRWYLSGVGQKEIARRLNALRQETPAQIQDKRCGKAQGKQYLWTYNSVRNVLREEAYTGVLVNHKYTAQNGKKLPVPADEQLRHEHYYPVLIERGAWEQVQRRLDEQTACYHAARPAMSNRPSHRYTGLLQCADCGAPFVPMIRRWNGTKRIEYACKSYNRHGKTACPSHRIHEECLDAELRAKAETLQNAMRHEQETVRSLQKLLALKEPRLNEKIRVFRNETDQLIAEIDALLMQKLFLTVQKTLVQQTYQG